MSCAARRRTGIWVRVHLEDCWHQESWPCHGQCQWAAARAMANNFEFFEIISRRRIHTCTRDLDNLAVTWRKS